jgi:hypothetical protein
VKHPDPDPADFVTLLGDMSLQPIDQCVERRSAAWADAQIFPHGDPGF